MNALVTLESQMRPLAPRFAEVLGNTMPVERLMRTVMISVERLPALLDCDRQSIFNAAMSAACLGLEVDGVTGQAYLIPFKGKAQLVIGYRGMNTLAARSGFTVTGACVREGDAFEYELGDSAFIRHKPGLAGGGTRRIVAAWACATAPGRTPIVVVLGVDEIMAIKARSPGGKRSDSPWNDQAVGFPAMAEKSAKRRLARSMPLNAMSAQMHMAACMDEAVDEQERVAWITPDKGVVLEGDILPPRHTASTPDAASLISPPARPAPTPSAGEPTPAVSPSPHGEAAGTPDPESGPAPTCAEYVAQWATIIAGATNAAQLGATWNGQKALRKRITWDDGAFDALSAKVKAAVAFLKG